MKRNTPIKNRKKCKDHDIDFLLLGVLPRTALALSPYGLFGPCPAWLSSSISAILFALKGKIPSFFQLKCDPLFFSNNFSICLSITMHWLCSLSTSSFNFLISICWRPVSRFEKQRADSSGPKGAGLLGPLKDPLQSMCLLISLDCSERRTWITARTGRRSFWAACKQASCDSLL